MRSRSLSRTLIAISAAAAPVVALAPPSIAAPAAPQPPLFPFPADPVTDDDEQLLDEPIADLPATPAPTNEATHEPTTQTSSVTRFVWADVGNVRSGPSLNHSVVGTMTRGTKVQGTWTNGWLNIGGGRYLSETILTSTNPTPTTPPTASTTRWVSVPAANVRSGPSTSYSIVGSRTQGQQVTGTLTSNGWLQIASGQFMAPSVLTATNPGGGGGATSVTRYVSANIANVRSGPSLNHSVVTTMVQGTKVEGTWTNGWLNLGNGRYMSETVLTSSPPSTPPPATTVTRYVSANVANVRSGPSTNHSVVGTKTQGTQVTGTLTSSGWLQLSANQFMSPGVLTSTPPATTPPPPATVTRYVSASVANVRSGPSTNHSVVGTKTHGTQVTGAVSTNGWLQLSANQFMSPGVLTSTPPAPAPPPPPAPTPIRQALIGTAAQYVGYPYVLYGTPPDAFDCSAYTWWIYKQNGIDIPRTVAAQRDIVIPVTNPQPGDLVFYKNYYHVGLYAGPGMSYEAQNPQAGVVYGPIWSNEVWYGRIPGM